jgi:hypothetical protein
MPTLEPVADFLLLGNLPFRKVELDRDSDEIFESHLSDSCATKKEELF